MRIFIIHNFYQHAGGEDTVFHQEVRELSKQHEVEVFTCKNSKGWKGILQYGCYPWNVFVSTQISKRVRQFRPDVVHIHNMHYALGPWIIRTLHQLGAPIVLTLHNYRLLCPSATLFFRGKLFKNSIHEDFPWTAVKNRVLEGSFVKTLITGFTYWFHRKIGTWNMVESFIVLSDFAKHMFTTSTFPVPATRFVVKSNAVDVMPVSEKREDQFVYIGRLSEEKGILPLLEAFADLQANIDVFGLGPQQNQVETLAQQHPNIHYKGFQNKEILSRALASANALLVPSVCYEGMPMTIIEAYGYGTPVLASNIGILSEMVVPLFTGLHFDPYSPGSIKETVLAWENLDRSQKEQIYRNCREEYVKQYTIPENIEKLEIIYRQAIAKQGDYGNNSNG